MGRPRHASDDGPASNRAKRKRQRFSAPPTGIGEVRGIALGVAVAVERTEHPGHPQHRIAREEGSRAGVVVPRPNLL